MTAQSDFAELSITLNVTIRQLIKDDLRKLEWHGEFKHYRRLFWRSYQGQLKNTRLMLVADVNNMPVGRLFIQFSSPRSKVSDGNSKAYLYSFNVMNVFRGHGLGTRLIQHAESILIQKDFRIATIAVSKENNGALRLYQRQNYTIYGEDEGRWQYYDHRGRLKRVYDPCWLLEKQLG